jgi:exopolysaccharide production protein ExoQ
MAQLATLLCFLCIAYLFWVDRKQAEGVSAAAWIPLMWMLFSGSRFASQWLDLGPPQVTSVEAYLEGSPLDRNVFLGLIIAGLVVLRRRKVNWSAVLTRNSWVVLFFVFAATSVLWADDASASFKRWVKGVGSVVMVLVIMTEARPYQALGLILRRLAYVLLPLSVLFIRYYPEFGRAYHMGLPMFTGVTFQKNALGQLCMLLAVYFSWELLFRNLKPVNSEGRVPLLVTLIILPMLLYLLYMSQSATSLAATIGAVSFLLVARLPFIAQKPRRIVGAAVVVAAVGGFLEYAFEIKDWIIRALGRQPDLTDRLPLWEMLFEMQSNPFVGAGYESFMSGDRLVELWRRMEMTGGAGQAHNGYIDLYLNLGIIGVSLLTVAILFGLVKTRRQLDHEWAYGVLRIALIVIALLYNFTEAAFKPLNNVFLLLLIGIMANVRASEANTSRRIRPLNFVGTRTNAGWSHQTRK